MRGWPLPVGEDIELEKITNQFGQPPHSLTGPALAIGGIVLLWSAIHFWPLSGNRIWELLCPMNSGVLLWLGILAVIVLLRRDMSLVWRWAPHVSVVAYVCISMLSAAAAPDTMRAITSGCKILLVLVGGYALFRCAMSSVGRLESMFRAALLALLLCLGGWFVWRIAFGGDRCGFFEDADKYGTYIAMLTPLCAGRLLMGRSRRARGFAALLIVAAIATSATLGGVVGVVVGTLVCIVVANSRSVTIFGAGAVCCAVVIAAIQWPGGPLRNDIRLLEDDGVNCRQRYVEWQALINSLESYGGEGMGVGCMNEYRSTFYYRLPKLNTLRPAEQNGWLVAAAESGVIGLMCLCWIFAHHFKSAWRSIADGAAEDRPLRACVISAFAALVGAGVSSVFCSIQYNGLLIIFAFILAVIVSTAELCGRQER